MFRTVVATEDGTIVFVVGGSVGEAFEVGGWTRSLRGHLRRVGRLDEGKAIMAQLIAEKPDAWAVDSSPPASRLCR